MSHHQWCLSFRIGLLQLSVRIFLDYFHSQSHRVIASLLVTILLLAVFFFFCCFWLARLSHVTVILICHQIVICNSQVHLPIIIFNFSSACNKFDSLPFAEDDFLYIFAFFLHDVLAASDEFLALERLLGVVNRQLRLDWGKMVVLLTDRPHRFTLPQLDLVVAPGSLMPMKRLHLDSLRINRLA